MRKHAPLWAMSAFFFASISAFAGVTVSSPGNGSTVGTAINFVANSSTSCSKGVASMGIYPSANWLVYGFPAIAAATAAVLIIAGIRLIARR